VLIEVAGPAGGRWLAGDGAPAAAVQASPLSFLQHLTGHPGGAAEGAGDPAVTARLLAVRIP